MMRREIRGALDAIESLGDTFTFAEVRAAQPTAGITTGTFARLRQEGAIVRVDRASGEYVGRTGALWRRGPRFAVMGGFE